MSKQYDKFNLEVEQDPLVQLHKTDYNNYSDLSHFVDEYYKAQALIKECGNFYKSFLLSKLLTYSKLTNTSYKENEYNFFNIHITGIPYKAETYCLYDMFDDLDNDYKGYYNYKSLKGYEKLAYSRAVFKFKEFCDNSKDKLFTIRIECNRTSYFPGDKDKETNYYFTFNDYIFKSCMCEHYISSYSSITYNNKYDEVNNKDLQSKLKKLVDKEKKSLYDYMKELDFLYKKEFDTFYKDELKKLFKTINVPIIYINIDNDLKDCAYASYNSYKKKVKSKDIDKDIKELTEKYNNDGERTSLYLSEILSDDEIDNMFDSFEYKGWYSMYDWILKYINDNYYNKIIELVKRNIADSTYAYRTIIRTCSEYNNNQKLYIIGKHNESHYFCNQNDVDKIKIELIERELVCTYIKVNKHLKYSWPSNAPTVVNELTRTVKFNVDTNSVSSFKESTDTYEIANKDRY